MLTTTAVKEGKKVAKVIKAEGKAEKKALEDAVKELAEIQKLQKSAVKVCFHIAVCVHNFLILLVRLGGRKDICLLLQGAPRFPQGGT